MSRAGITYWIVTDYFYFSYSIDTMVMLQPEKAQPAPFSSSISS